MCGLYYKSRAILSLGFILLGGWVGFHEGMSLHNNGTKGPTGKIKTLFLAVTLAIPNHPYSPISTTVPTFWAYPMGGYPPILLKSEPAVQDLELPYKLKGLNAI